MYVEYRLDTPNVVYFDYLFSNNFDNYILQGKLENIS